MKNEDEVLVETGTIDHIVKKSPALRPEMMEILEINEKRVNRGRLCSEKIS